VKDTQFRDGFRVTRNLPFVDYDMKVIVDGLSGVIKGFRNGTLIVKFNRSDSVKNVNPSRDIKYFDADGKLLHDSANQETFCSDCRAFITCNGGVLKVGCKFNPSLFMRKVAKK